MTSLPGPAVLRAFCTAARQDWLPTSGSQHSRIRPDRLSTPLQQAAGCWTRRPGIDRKKGEGRLEGGSVALQQDMLSHRFEATDVNSQKHRDTSTACRYDSNSSLVTLLRHVDAFRQVVCTNSRGVLNSSSTPQWSDTREANYATRSHDGPWIASWYYLHGSSTNFSRKVEWLYAGILLGTWKGSHGTSICCS